MLLPILGVLFSVACLWAAVRSARRQRLVNDLPTSKTTGVFIGLVELKGTAELASPLTSYLAGRSCVYYQWSIDERWSRLVTETYVDSNGKTRTRTRTESGWTTVANGGQMQAFYLKDDCGYILIRPEAAKIEPQTVFSESCYIGNPLYYGKGPATSVPNSDHYRRFTETAIVLHTPLYVVGQARERQDIVAAEIANDPAAPMFLISTRSEEQVSSGLGWSKWGWLIFGLILLLTGFFLMDKNAATPNYIIPAVAGITYLFVAFCAWVWMVFNSLVDLRQRVRQGWSQVDVQLKRRFDLIPNIERVVKGLRDYEKNTQTELARLRAESQATPPGQPGPDYHAVAATMKIIAEKYPELTAQPAFLELQKSLSDTEQRIALARGYYNEIATYYNIRREIVPDRFIAALARLKPAPLMEANDFERAPIQVPQFQ